MNGQNDPTPSDALRALRSRGVNRADELLEVATESEILAACHRWDREKNVSPGLLVHWIRNGEFDAPEAKPAQSKGAQLRARFDEYANRFPVGTVAETHAHLLARRWPNDPDQCAGDMVVTDTDYPVIATECDQCRFTVGVPAQALHVLTGPEREAPF